MGSGEVLTEDLKKRIDTMVQDNTVIAFIKGTKLFPQCGFSNTVVQIFNNLGVPYETVDVLELEQLRVAMKEYSMWPTFPQVYINGEFYGGCDILIEAY